MFVSLYTYINHNIVIIVKLVVVKLNSRDFFFSVTPFESYQLSLMLYLIGYYIKLFFE